MSSRGRELSLSSVEFSGLYSQHQHQNLSFKDQVAYGLRGFYQNAQACWHGVPSGTYGMRLDLCIERYDA